MACSFIPALAFIAAAMLVSAPSHASDEPPTEFSKHVTAALGDWEAEDWRRGTLTLHPTMYTWQSDVYLNLLAEEDVADRSAQQVLASHFEGDDLGDDSLEPTKLDLRIAKELAPGILAVKYRWTYAFDDILGFWGVITTANNSYIAFSARCEVDDPDTPNEYRFDTCLRKMLTGVAQLQSGQLKMPDPSVPLNVAGWEGQYASDGTSIAVNNNYNGLRKATLYVTPPRIIAPDQLPAAIKQMSDNLVDEFDDQIEKNPGMMRWVGATDNPWIRREYPEAFDGPSIHMAGSERTAEGKTVLIGVRCPNKGWLKSCAYGVEQAKLQIRSGMLEARRQKIIAATQIPLPVGGLKDAQIAGIYTEGRNVMGAGGFMTGYEIDGPVLLKDGRAFSDFGRPPAFIDPVADAQENHGQWGRWTRAGGNINIRWNDNDTTTIPVAADNFMTGGPKGMRLSGEYRHVSGGGSQAFGGGNSFLSESSYTFFPDGTFSSDRSSSFMVGPGAGGDGASAMGGSNGGGTRGRYDVDGYTLKLTYPDGRITRLSFAAYVHEMVKADRESLMLNGTVYFRDDGK
jgi:hypothetical protein